MTVEKAFPKALHGEMEVNEVTSRHHAKAALAVSFLALTLCASVSVADAAASANSCQWHEVGTADLDGDRKPELVEMRTCGLKGGVRATIQGQARSIEFPIGSQDQFGVCGTNPSASLASRSSGPLDAFGAYPPGYDACLDCSEITIEDGDCDALHIYWRDDVKSFFCGGCNERPVWVDPGRTASAIGALFFRQGWFAGHSHVNHTRHCRRS